MKQILKNILFIIIILIFIIIALESITRIVANYTTSYDIEIYKYSKFLTQHSTNPAFFIEHKPNSGANIMGVTINLNNYGIRNKNISKKKETNEYRVLGAGGSTTLGWGVKENETYLALLENKYKSLNKNIIFLNSGIINYNIEMLCSLSKEQFYKLNPDCILFSYFMSGLEDIKPEYSNFILKNSYIYAYLYVKIKKIIYALKLKDKTIYDYYSDLYNSDKWIKAQKNMLDLKYFCDKNKIPLFVVIIPDLHETNDNSKIINIYKKTYDFFITNNIPCLNIYDYYNTNFRELWVANDDLHPNAKGHKIFADIIYDFLEKENFILRLNKKNNYSLL